MTKDPREKAQELELDRSTEEHPKQFERDDRHGASSATPAALSSLLAETD